MAHKVLEFGSAPLETLLASSANNPGNTRTSAQLSESSKLWPAWNPDAYATEQIRGLVQQVFFPGWPKASRQVVLCGADQQAVTLDACARIAHTMAETLP